MATHVLQSWKCEYVFLPYLSVFFLSTACIYDLYVCDFLSFSNLFFLFLLVLPSLTYLELYLAGFFFLISAIIFLISKNLLFFFP